MRMRPRPGELRVVDRVGERMMPMSFVEHMRAWTGALATLTLAGTLLSGVWRVGGCWGAVVGL